MSLGRQNACLTKAQMGLLTEAGNMGRPCTQLGWPLASLPLGPSLARLFLSLLAGLSASLAQGARSIGAQEALAPLRRLTAWKFCPEPIGSAVARDLRERFQKPWPLLQGKAEVPIKEQPGDGTRF
jgi:hypothetical protein